FSRVPGRRPGDDVISIAERCSANGSFDDDPQSQFAAYLRAAVAFWKKDMRTISRLMRTANNRQFTTFADWVLSGYAGRGMPYSGQPFGEECFFGFRLSDVSEEHALLLRALLSPTRDKRDTGLRRKWTMDYLSPPMTTPGTPRVRKIRDEDTPKFQRRFQKLYSAGPRLNDKRLRELDELVEISRGDTLSEASLARCMHAYHHGMTGLLAHWIAAFPIQAEKQTMIEWLAETILPELSGINVEFSVEHDEGDAYVGLFLKLKKGSQSNQKVVAAFLGCELKVWKEDGYVHCQMTDHLFSNELTSLMITLTGRHLGNNA
ncbi:MAG: hypothetical protein ABGZ35_11950, partial [Planctomycetaceae bacterium]